MDKPTTIKRKCKLHGETDFYLVTQNKNSYRCKKCRAFHVLKNRRENKRKLIELHGGACKLCGYKRCQRALEFHHIDPTQKSFAISEKGYTRSFELLKKESEKCILLCSNCHKEIEDGLIKI